MNYEHKRYITSSILDDKDIRILMYIYLGVGQATHIGMFMGMPKTTIRDRAAKLEELGYVDRVNQNYQIFYRGYKLTEKATKIIDEIMPSRIDFNLFLLALKRIELSHAHSDNTLES